MRTIEVMTATFWTPLGEIRVSGHPGLGPNGPWGIATGGMGSGHWKADLSASGLFGDAEAGHFLVMWPGPGETMATLIRGTPGPFRVYAQVDRVLIADESRPDTEGVKAC